MRFKKSDNGKGSENRIKDFNKYRENYNRIFRKKTIVEKLKDLIK